MLLTITYINEQIDATNYMSTSAAVIQQTFDVIDDTAVTTGMGITSGGEPSIQGIRVVDCTPNNIPYASQIFDISSYQSVIITDIDNNVTEIPLSNLFKMISINNNVIVTLKNNVVQTYSNIKSSERSKNNLVITQADDSLVYIPWTTILAIEHYPITITVEYIDKTTVVFQAPSRRTSINVKDNSGNLLLTTNPNLRVISVQVLPTTIIKDVNNNITIFPTNKIIQMVFSS